MSIRSFTALDSNLASVTDLKNSNSTQFMLWFWRWQNFSNLLFRLQNSSLSPSLMITLIPYLSSGNLSYGWSSGPEGNQRLRGQNQQPSFWGSPPAQLWLVWLASTNIGHFKSAAVTDSLLAATSFLEKNMLLPLWYWPSSRVKKVLMLCIFHLATSHFHVKWNFWWNWAKVVANQGHTHCFPQSFHYSLVSE